MALTLAHIALSLRLDLLKLAQDQANQRFYSLREDFEAENRDITNTNVTMCTKVFPTFPTSEDIIAEAEKFKAFVNN